MDCGLSNEMCNTYAFHTQHLFAQKTLADETPCKPPVERKVRSTEEGSTASSGTHIAFHKEKRMDKAQHVFQETERAPYRTWKDA
ncbi:Hypothetical predicted protein [Pelobates cultripes]|uniref:Uncharacterized protein n=1 Tax=Pelobates cultripes TaxID=61616 RepID=A0AAD1RY02_PELCU|nr:Hypothetical predicted protein [Pelobates cultripes]